MGIAQRRESRMETADASLLRSQRAYPEGAEEGTVAAFMRHVPLLPGVQRGRIHAPSPSLCVKARARADLHRVF